MKVGLFFGELLLRNYIVRTLIGIWKHAAPPNAVN